MGGGQAILLKRKLIDTNNDVTCMMKGSESSGVYSALLTRMINGSGLDKILAAYGDHACFEQLG